MPTSAFLRYIIENEVQPTDPLPSLSDLSSELGVSVGKLREQVACAREAGIISLKPRVGMRREPFDFHAIVREGVAFGMATGDLTFDHLREVRNALEQAFWYQAVHQLTPENATAFYTTIEKAKSKLDAGQIPHKEHRQFHLDLFQTIANPLLIGLLETYWDVYASSEFNRYRPLDYWVTVWDYHERIVDALCAQEKTHALTLLEEHFNLLQTRLLEDKTT